MKLTCLPSEKKRVLRVTAGNLRQNHIYINEHFDFFPSDCVGAPKRAAQRGQSIEIVLDGLDQTVTTDIGRDAATDKARSFFRSRGWVRDFYKHHSVKPGALLALERLSDRTYRLSIEQPAPAVIECAEFFAGIGLVRLALERQGWRVVFANDIDPKKAEMYRQNWTNDDHLVVGDIHALKPDDLPRCALYTASFPCNDLSIAGRWEGLKGKESSAFWGLVHKLSELGDDRPPLVLLENVVGFLMSHGGRDLEDALLAMNRLGYAVDALILNATHWVPQSRPRLFVIAKRQDDIRERRTFALASETRPQSLVRFISKHQNIQWDIRDLPLLPKRSTRLADIVENLPKDDAHWWNAKRVEYFMNQLSPKHAAEASQMIAGKSYTYATAFRRVRNGRSMAELRTDGIAGCLRTPRGGSGRQILFKAGRGKYQVRLLTPRECARLQGVPDSYVVDVPLNQALFGFGDAVCVPALEWIVEHYLKSVVSTLETQQNHD